MRCEEIMMAVASNVVSSEAAGLTPGDQGGSIIRAIAPGYLMEVAAGEFDVEVFTQLTDRASQAEAGRDWKAAVTDLSAALGLWRGDPQANVASPMLEGGT
jgi:hypothetical protein